MLQSTTPIGIFDSGIGGLSVLKEVRKLLPSEQLIYFADSIHLPYGDRAIDEIYTFSEAIIEFLMVQDCKVIVIACNTASAAAIHPLRIKYPTFQFIGMEPAIKPAAENTQTGKVGVLATVATFQGQLFKSVIERFAKDVEVITQPCAGLVQQIEAGKFESQETEEMLRNWLKPMMEAGIDRLVLGCTHYPFVEKTIRKIVGPYIQIIDPAPAVAMQLKRVLEQSAGLNTDAIAGNIECYTTGDVNQFLQMSSMLISIHLIVHHATWSDTKIILK